MVKLASVMRPEVATVQSTATIEEAVSKLAKDADSCIVVQEQEKIVGIITSTDIIRKISTNKVNTKHLVTKIMGSPVTTINHEDSLEKASKVIDTKLFSNYPVVDGSKTVGYVTRSDVIQALNSNLRIHRSLQNAVLVVFLIYLIGIVLYFGMI